MTSRLTTLLRTGQLLDNFKEYECAPLAASDPSIKVNTTSGETLIVSSSLGLTDVPQAGKFLQDFKSMPLSVKCEGDDIAVSFNPRDALKTVQNLDYYASLTKATQNSKKEEIKETPVVTVRPPVVSQRVNLPVVTPVVTPKVENDSIFQAPQTAPKPVDKVEEARNFIAKLRKEQKAILFNVANVPNDLQKYHDDEIDTILDFVMELATGDAEYRKKVAEMISL